MVRPKHVEQIKNSEIKGICKICASFWFLYTFSDKDNVSQKLVAQLFFHPELRTENRPLKGTVEQSAKDDSWTRGRK